jgi:GTPase SAR1 family protein
MSIPNITTINIFNIASQANSEYIIDCDFYQRVYTGPFLRSILVDNHNDIDLYNKMNELYGSKRNWNGKIYKAGIIFTPKYKNKLITFNYLLQNGRTYETKYIYKNNNEIFNPVFFVPDDDDIYSTYVSRHAHSY